MPQKNNDKSNNFFKWIRDTKIYRSDDRILAGVCAGISEKYNFNLTATRVLYIVLGCLLGPGILIYAVCWIVIPDKKDSIPLEDALVYGKIRSDFVGAIILFIVGSCIGIIHPISVIFNILIIVIAIIVCINLAKGDKVSKTDITDKVDEMSDKITDINKNIMAKADKKIDQIVEKVQTKTEEKAEKQKENLDKMSQKIQTKMEEKSNKFKSKFDTDYYESKYAQSKDHSKNTRKNKRWPSTVSYTIYGLGFIALGLMMYFHEYIKDNFTQSIAISIIITVYSLLLAVVIIIEGVKSKKPSPLTILLIIVTIIACLNNTNEMFNRDRNIVNVNFDNHSIYIDKQNHERIVIDNNGIHAENQN